MSELMILIWNSTLKKLQPELFRVGPSQPNQSESSESLVCSKVGEATEEHGIDVTSH